MTLQFGGISATSYNTDVNAGDAGNIVIYADTIRVKDEGRIITATNSASGGDITLITSNLLYLYEKSFISTSAEGGDGKGGNIRIEKPAFVILNYGAIIANAYGGPGGNISIIADQFIKDTDSIISASSELGIDGEISIDAPDTDIAGSIAVLPESYIDAASLLKNPCESRTKENTSRLVNTGTGKASLSPEESFPGSFYQKQKNTETSESSDQKSEKQKTRRMIFKNKRESSK